MGNRFDQKIDTFDSDFVSYRKKVTDNARLYLHGIVRDGIRKNMSQIAQRVPNASPENLQNFISDSKWDAQAVMDRVAQQVNDQIGDVNDTCLIIDECGIAKKGEKSVGVTRQWLGSEGKVDNGLVGVYTALCKGNNASLIDARLYLPQDWAGNPKRCLEAGVPQEHIVFKTKDQIALEMVCHAREIGMKYNWIGTDGGYGKGLNFMRELNTMNETFMVDIHSDFNVYIKPVKPYLPVKEPGTRGRDYSRYQVDQNPVRVDQWAKRQSKIRMEENNGSSFDKRRS